jgi:hypothetical protein
MGLALEAAQQAAFGGDPRSDNQCPDFKALKKVEAKVSAAAEEGIQQVGGGGTSSGASGNGVSSASSEASSVRASASAAPTVIKEGPLIFFNKAGKRVNRFFQLVKAPTATADGTQLTLLAFKADPNPQRLQPSPVGAAESASAR